MSNQPLDLKEEIQMLESRISYLENVHPKDRELPKIRAVYEAKLKELQQNG